MVKKMIKILHLYHDLLNLYGDYANAEVLALALMGQGYETVIEKKSVGDDISLDGYDFVYIGSGTERSLIACISDIVSIKKELIDAIESGVPMLASGNSHELFGRSIIDKGNARHECLGLFDFETVQGDGRVTGDCVCKSLIIENRIIGFINRASVGQQGEIARPFIMEIGTGSADGMSIEGVHYNNLLGTYITGPILVRNPALLRYFADMTIRFAQSKPDGNSIINVKSEPELLTRDIGLAEPELSDEAKRARRFFAYQEEAYKRTLKELLARAEK